MNADNAKLRTLAELRRKTRQPSLKLYGADLTPAIAVDAGHHPRADEPGYFGKDSRDAQGVEAEFLIDADLDQIAAHQALGYLFGRYPDLRLLIQPDADLVTLRRLWLKLKARVDALLGETPDALC